MLAAQHVAQRQPAADIERSGAVVDHNVVEQSGLRGEFGIAAPGQQDQAVPGMMAADRRHRAQRLNKIAERAELDDQDAAPAGHRRRPVPLRSQTCQVVEVDMLGQLLEGPENRRMRGWIRGSDGGSQRIYRRLRRGHRRRAGKRRDKFSRALDCCR